MFCGKSVNSQQIFKIGICEKVIKAVNAMETVELVDFEDKKFDCSEMYDVMLMTDYGDYTQLPPEEERTWKHHPILTDLNRNYEDIISEK